MVKPHKVIFFFNVILSLFLLNRNLAWNKIAIIHPSAFSTLPSLRKLWVFYYLSMAGLFIIKGHLTPQCTDCPALSVPHTRAVSDQRGAPYRSKAMWAFMCITEDLGDSCSHYWGEIFHFCWAIRWNGIAINSVLKGFRFRVGHLD